MHTPSRNLAFLLSLSAVLGCVGDDMSTTSDTASTTNDTDSASGSTGDTATDNATDSTSSTTGEASGSRTPCESSTACAAVAAKYVECGAIYDPAEEFQYYCEFIVAHYQLLYGRECAVAYEELFSCLSELNCADLELGDACDAEGQATVQSCVSSP